MRMNNRWNQFIYRLWAPVYDGTVGHLFMAGRRQAMALLDLKPGESVLLMGVGTGADLPLLSSNVCAVGIDLSPEMLAKARAKLPLAGREVLLVRGDVQQMAVRHTSFDAAVLNLILSVVPDGAACLDATWRALRIGGRAVVFDKFLPGHSNPTLARCALNEFSTVFGTDINRRFGDLIAGKCWEILHEEASILGGMYRVIMIRRGS